MLQNGSGWGENGHTFPLKIESGRLYASMQFTLAACLAGLLNLQDYNLNRSHSRATSMAYEDSTRSEGPICP